MDRLEIVTKYYHRHIRGSTILLLFFLIVICNAFSACSTYATDSITLNIDTNNLAINLMPLSSSGDFAKSNNMNISVSTTSTSGYTLGIVSSTGSTDLTNQSDNTKKINSISSPLSESDFSNSSNTQYNNKWGYKPSQYTTLDSGGHPTIYPNTNFRPLPGTSGEIIAKTECANGTAPCTNPTDTYTLSIGVRANNQTATGKYVSDTFIITAVTNKNVITCDSSKLCVQYDGNGLSYPETSSQLPRTVNNVNYNSTGSTETVTKYSHTSNISDDGTKSGSYASKLATKDPITIPGASELNITITYGTENNWDMLYIFQGEYTGDISRNMSQSDTGWLYKYMGGDNTTTTVTITIPGDTVTFGFYSDGSSQYYGYYAIITGTASTLERSVASGEYAEPTGENAIFHGWSTSQTTPGGGLHSDVEYANESEILAKMPGDEGETKTLYAVWQQKQTITFTKDSNVTKIDVLNASGDTVGTITSSGQSLALIPGDTYTIKPTHATGYGTNTITKTSGAGTLSGKQFTVGAGAATINVTSKPLSPMQNWTGCSSLAQGDTEEVYDTRDNEVYLIGKLADDKCWMLDNLRLDLGNSTVLSNTTESNTNASTTTLNYLKNGGGSTSDRYPTAKINNVAWTSDSQDYYSIPMTISTYKDQTTTSYGEGSGKIGVYYNYCAASAGNYCFGNGTSEGSPSGNATEDICPKGWRMPTGGSSGEYQALYTAYSSDVTSFLNALSTPLSGYFSSGSAGGQGTYGFFWSSTYSNAFNMYLLYVNSSNVYPSSNGDRHYGDSVRCLLGS